MLRGVLTTSWGKRERACARAAREEKRAEPTPRNGQFPAVSFHTGEEVSVKRGVLFQRGKSEPAEPTQRKVSKDSRLERTVRKVSLGGQTGPSRHL